MRLKPSPGAAFSCALAAALLWPPAPAAGGETGGSAPPFDGHPLPARAPADDFYGRHIRGHLEAGTRVAYFALLEDQRGERNKNSFVGSITKLREDASAAPARFYLQYRIAPSFGLGVSYDRFGAEAWDHAGTDGTAVLSGPLVYLLGCYPNWTPFTPFGELGAGFYSAEFRNAPGWGQAGNKKMLLNDTTGWYVALGCDLRLLECVSVNLYSRYMNVDVDGIYLLDGRKRSDIIFTTSHLLFGLGAKYVF